MTRILFYLCFSLLFIGAKTGQCQSEKRKALLIGNSNYVYYSPLSNSIRDVDSMEVALKTLGFEVTVKKNTEYRTLVSSVNSFIQDLEKDDIALLYYSGHGIGYNGNNYILPIEEGFDCLNQLEELIPISLNRIVRNMEYKGVKNSFVFLDACRNSPSFKKCDNSKATLDKSEGFVIPSNNPKGNLIFFATREGGVANDNTYDKVNSLFTSELLKYIRIPDLSIRTIIDKVISGVEQRSDYKQIPQKLEDLRGDFYFLKTSDEEKARIAAEIKKKQENEIRAKIKKEIEESNKAKALAIEESNNAKAKQVEENNKAIAKAKEVEDKKLADQKKLTDELVAKKAIEVKVPDKIVTDNLEQNKLVFIENIKNGDNAFQNNDFKGALNWYESAKAFEKICKECSISNKALDETILTLNKNIEIKEYKSWKTSNKILLVTSLLGVGLFTKYSLDFKNAKNDLATKQQIADQNNDNIVYLSSISKNNFAINDYQLAYTKLEEIKKNSSIYSACLAGGALFGTTYLVKKIIGKKKPNTFEITPFNKGLSLSIAF